MKEYLKKLLPDALCVALFVVIAFAYFFAPVMDGKRILGHDNTANDGLQVELRQYRDSHNGETPRWINSIFGGMPTYQIAPSYDSMRTMTFFEKVWHLWLPDYVWYIFASMLGFYLLLRAFDFKQWMAALGAIIWAFSSYFFIIIAAGHIWKVITLAYIPPTIAGMVWLYRGKYLRGLLVTAFFGALQISGNHVQMTYYFLIVEIALFIAFCIQRPTPQPLPREGSGHSNMLGSNYAPPLGGVRGWVYATGLLVLAAVIALALNISNLYHTYEYAKDTMRGKSELVKAGQNAANQTDSGLERDYITAWSYGLDETWTFLVPNVKGGASVPLSESRTAMKKADPTLTGAGVYQAFTQYWGEQPMTSGPVYLGALVCMLFVLALIILPNRSAMKWALLAATLLSILLSWGRNFMPLTDFFIDHVPMYSKFRTVASILVVAEFTIPLLAMLGLKRFCEGCAVKEQRPKMLRALVLSTAVTVVICLLFALFPTAAGDCVSSNDRNAVAQYVAQGYFDSFMGQSILASISTMRAALLSADAWRSILIIMLGAVVLYWMWKKEASRSLVFMGLLIAICLVDMWQVNKRYINDGMFQTPPTQQIPAPNDAQQYILSKSGDGRNYRVADLTVSTFNDNFDAFYFSSIGGYHAAKLRRYQELVEACIAPELQNYYTALSQATLDTLKMAEAGDYMHPLYDFSEVNTDSLMPVLNMLNTRWFILSGQNGQKIPIENPTAYGNAWFVDEVLPVTNANEELDALHKVNPHRVAVINTKDFPLQLSTLNSQLSTIEQTSLTPNSVTYETDNAEDGLVVFSEIYYPGWTATIDGKPADILRTDYVLRAMQVPAGKHIIMMTFDPQSVHTTELIAYIALGVLLLLVIGGVVLTLKRRKDYPTAPHTN